jgi:hypothetical protein
MPEPVGGSLSGSPFYRFPSPFPQFKVRTNAHSETQIQMNPAPKPFSKKMLVRFVIELVIYAVLVTVYLGLVLTFLVYWLKELFVQQRGVYAFVSIVLMILQAVGLEKLTTVLVHVNRRRQG